MHIPQSWIAPVLHNFKPVLHNLLNTGVQNQGGGVDVC